MEVSELLAELTKFRQAVPAAKDETGLCNVYRRWIDLLKQHLGLITPEMIEPLFAPPRIQGRVVLSPRMLFERLGPVAVPEVRARIRRELQDEQAERRAAACFYLVAVAPDDPETATALWALHRDERPMVRSDAAGAVAVLALSTETVCDRLLADLAAGEPLLRIFCAIAVASLLVQLKKVERILPATIAALCRPRQEEEVDTTLRKALKSVSTWAIDATLRVLGKRRTTEEDSAEVLGSARAILSTLAAVTPAEATPDAEAEEDEE